MTDSRFPTITPVEWLTAKEVLGGEASDFTPWLQQPESMATLGAALKLDDLTTVRTEHNVYGKRLDILASALDESGDEIPVCIENQYGRTDADHLGRLIAYLAQHDRGRAVWVVESADDAYVAAVRFLNRTSSEDVGYYLVQVRLTHGAGQSYQVHFEVLAAPIEWERIGMARNAAARPVNRSKADYLHAILEAVRPGLEAAGFSSMNAHRSGSYLHIAWPRDLWIRQFSQWIDIKVTGDSARVPFYVRNLPTREANTTAMSIIEGRYTAAIEARMPPGTRLDWYVGGAGVREIVRAQLDGAGYLDGDPEAAAAWAEQVVLAWLDVVRSDPITDLAEQVEASLPGQGYVASESVDHVEGE